MDGNNFVSVRMAQLKAHTCADIPISSKALSERNEKLSGPYIGVPGVVLLEGGLSIITQDGRQIGAIGISGATPGLGGICAKAAIGAVVFRIIKFYTNFSRSCTGFFSCF